jgi:AcrR family transcriptional regulator
MYIDLIPSQAKKSRVSKRRYRMSARAEAAAATGERLMTAAWDHFAARPFEEVRLRDVAADAGVTVQTLHARFGSKDELLAAAYQWWGNREIERRDAAVGRPRDAIRIVFDHYEAHGEAILRMLSQEDRIPAIRESTDLGRAYHREWAERVFASLLEGLPPAARERRLNALVIATDVLVWKLLRLDMRLPRREAERTVAEIVDAAGAYSPA